MWEMKYAPQTRSDLIMNEHVKEKLDRLFITRASFLLHGKHGIGKGSFVNVFLKETESEYIWINGSDDGGIDVMRSKVKNFGRAFHMDDKPKFIVFNEADRLSFPAQALLREEMELVHSMTRFIFMANYVNNIMPEIRSRCYEVEIVQPPAIDMLKRCEYILASNGIVYNQKDVAGLVKLCYPDMRKIIINLENSVKDGEFKLVSMISSTDYNSILSLMLKKDLDGLRKYLKNSTIDYVSLYNFLFENVDKFQQPGNAIIEIGEHLYRHNQSPIVEINFIHMVVKMMKEGIV